MNCATVSGKIERACWHRIPSLVNIGKKRTINEIQKILKPVVEECLRFNGFQVKERLAIVLLFIEYAFNIGQSPAFSEHSTTLHLDIRNKEFGFEARYVNKVWKN